MTYAKNDDGLPISLYDTLELWAKNRLPTKAALRLTGLTTFADLMQCTLDHGIALEFNPTAEEKRQAARFAKALQGAGYSRRDDQQ